MRRLKELKNDMREMIKKYCSQIYGIFRKGKISERPLRRKYYQKRFEMTLRQWLIYHQREIVFNQVTWMGTPTFKNILDAWIYQEIIYEIQPDVIVEIGSKYGGSTKYFANLLDILGKGMVISIDIDRSAYNLVHKRVRLLTGNSSDPKILSKVECLCRGRTVMVIQDGDHRRKQALEDLENYSKYVSLNSYFIMEDGIVDLYHHGDGLGFQDEGPLAAIEDFLSRNSNFVIDSLRERYILTYNPNGFLKRIS
jgi:cephalosporin hydroxylase